MSNSTVDLMIGTEGDRMISVTKAKINEGLIVTSVDNLNMLFFSSLLMGKGFIFSNGGNIITKVYFQNGKGDDNKFFLLASPALRYTTIPGDKGISMNKVYSSEVVLWYYHVWCNVRKRNGTLPESSLLRFKEFSDHFAMKIAQYTSAMLIYENIKGGHQFVFADGSVISFSPIISENPCAGEVMEGQMDYKFVTKLSGYTVGGYN